MSRLVLTPIRLLASIFIFWLLTGCEGNSKVFLNTIDVAKNEYVSIEIVPDIERVNDDDDWIIEVGQETTFTVYAYDKEGNRNTLNSKKVSWSLDCNPANCAWINESGKLTGTGNGIATVVGHYGGLISPSVAIKVSDAKLDEIMITGVLDPSLINFCQQSEEINAIGFYDDNTTRMITHLSDWRVEGNPKAQIFKQSNGSVYFSVQDNTPFTIIATYKSKQGRSESIVAEGSPPDVISILPQNPTIFTGSSQKFFAEASWDNSPLEEVTYMVTWQTDQPDSLSFSNKTTAFDLSDREDGLATGVSARTNPVNISAVCGAVEVTTSAIVKEGRITSIKVVRESNPTDVSPYTIGRSPVSFVAYAVYEDDIQSDKVITFDCDWLSDGGDSASIKIGAGSENADKQEDKKGYITGLRATDASLGNAEVKVIYKGEKNPDGSYPEAFFKVIVN